MLTAKELKNFLKDIPDNAAIIFGDGNITCLFDGNAVALNKWGAIWENGVGYFSSTSCCGECSHFDCLRCRKEIK